MTFNDSPDAPPIDPWFVVVMFLSVMILVLIIGRVSNGRKLP